MFLPKVATRTLSMKLKFAIYDRLVVAYFSIVFILIEVGDQASLKLVPRRIGAWVPLCNWCTLHMHSKFHYVILEKLFIRLLTEHHMEVPLWHFHKVLQQEVDCCDCKENTKYFGKIR